MVEPPKLCGLCSSRLRCHAFIFCMATTVALAAARPSDLHELQPLPEIPPNSEQAAKAVPGSYSTTCLSGNVHVALATNAAARLRSTSAPA